MYRVYYSGGIKFCLIQLPNIFQPYFELGHYRMSAPTKFLTIVVTIKYQYVIIY